MKELQSDRSYLDDFLDGKLGRNIWDMEWFHPNFFKSMRTFHRDVNFPKYNQLRMTNGDILLEIALAGYSKDDIIVELADNVLTVRTVYQESGHEPDEFKQESRWVDDGVYMRKGVASRGFSISWNLVGNWDVGEITFVNGMLNIPLHVNPPPESKPKVFDIK